MEKILIMPTIWTEVEVDVSLDDFDDDDLLEEVKHRRLLPAEVFEPANRGEDLLNKYEALFLRELLFNNKPFNIAGVNFNDLDLKLKNLI